VGTDAYETYVWSMDFQIHPTLSNYERIAFGGHSTDPNFQSKLLSGFIYYEDVLNSQVLWAKELSSLSTSQIYPASI
jgi:hypothetical protein